MKSEYVGSMNLTENYKIGISPTGEIIYGQTLPSGSQLIFDYTDQKGVSSRRIVKVKSVRNNVLTCHDLSKNECRSFKIGNMENVQLC